MPNRVLRDWTDSESIDKLSVHSERFFIRLIMKVDDYGRYTANVRMLKSLLFPLRTDVRETDITRWLAECEQSGLIVLYIVASKEYVQIENFKQQLRQKIEKYPSPEQCYADDTHTNSTCTLETKQNPETKPKPEKVPDELVFPFLSDEFKESWVGWKDYRKNEFKKSYKSVQTENAALKHVFKLSKEDEKTAIEIIEQSIANQWQGIFELKKSKQDGSKFNDGSGQKLGTSEARTKGLESFVNG